jgi:23S rRNA pseudouridine1911/1915/1917 synthase
LTHIGHPIVADKAYSGRDRLTMAELIDPVLVGPGFGTDLEQEMVLIDRQALHAHALRFTHPTTGREIALSAPLPADMARSLDALRRHRAVAHRNG